MFLIGSAIDWKIAIQMGNVNFMFYLSLSLSLSLGLLASEVHVLSH